MPGILSLKYKVKELSAGSAELGYPESHTLVTVELSPQTGTIIHRFAGLFVALGPLMLAFRAVIILPYRSKWEPRVKVLSAPVGRHAA